MRSAAYGDSLRVVCERARYEGRAGASRHGGKQGVNFRGDRTPLPAATITPKPVPARDKRVGAD